MVFTKEEIRQRIRIVDVWLTDERTAIGGVVPEGNFEYVVMITLTGDTQQNRQVDIDKLEEDGEYTRKWSNIPVAPAAMVHLMPNYDIEQPIYVGHGGSQLYGIVSGNSLQAMKHYWIDEI